MSVMINLLPDIRQAKIRAKRRRQLAVGIATVVVAASVGVVALLTIVTLAQKARIAELQRQIDENHQKFKEVEDIELILTVQQHMDSIPMVRTNRTAMVKFFQTLSTVSPRDMRLSSLELDNASGLTFSGTARSYAIVHKFTEALEASNVELGSDAKEDNDHHFTDIQLDSVARDGNNTVSFNVKATMAQGVTSAEE